MTGDSGFRRKLWTNHSLYSATESAGKDSSGSKSAGNSFSRSKPKSPWRLGT